MVAEARRATTIIACSAGAGRHSGSVAATRAMRARSRAGSFETATLHVKSTPRPQSGLDTVAGIRRLLDIDVTDGVGLEPGWRPYFFGLAGLRGKRLDDARVARFGASGLVPRR